MSVVFETAPAKSLDTEHIVRVVKGSNKTLNEKIMQKHMDAVIAGVITTARANQGWSMEIVKPTPYSIYKQDYNRTGEDTYTYYINFKVSCKPLKERPNIDAEFLAIVEAIQQKIKFPAKWNVDLVDGDNWKKKKDEEAKTSAEKANV